MNKMVSMRKTLKMIKIEGVPNVSYGNVTNNKSKKKHSRKTLPTDETKHKNKLQGLRRMLGQYITYIKKRN